MNSFRPGARRACRYAALQSTEHAAASAEFVLSSLTGMEETAALHHHPNFVIAADYPATGDPRRSHPGQSGQLRSYGCHNPE
jgi:hypothetical protein